MAEPPELIEMRSMIEEARKRFRGKCRGVLRKAYEDADSLSTGIGEISEYQAFDAWVRRVMQEIRRVALTDHTPAKSDAQGSSGEL